MSLMYWRSSYSQLGHGQPSLSPRIDLTGFAVSGILGGAPQAAGPGTNIGLARCQAIR